MKIAKSIAIVILVGIGVALMGVPVDAQQPSAAPTPAPRNPNWCSDVPASTPPLNRISPEEWASMRQRCMNEANADVVCLETCEGARELWKRAKEGPPKEAPKYPLSTDKLQGPFPLQGGAKGWIVPLPPGVMTPAVTATPTAFNQVPPPLILDSAPT